MISRPDIQAMFDELNEKHFDNGVPNIPVLWNTRMTTTAGYCRYNKVGFSMPVEDRVAMLMSGRDYSKDVLEPSKIELSDKLFRNNGYDVEKIEHTLIHEMVHAFLIHKYNEKGHTARFQRMMTDITGEYKNHRCHNYDTTGLRRTQTKNILWVCQGRCGAEGRKARMPKRGRTYTCRTCGGRVRFIDLRKRAAGGSKIFPPKLK